MDGFRAISKKSGIKKGREPAFNRAGRALSFWVSSYVAKIQRFFDSATFSVKKTSLRGAESDTDYFLYYTIKFKKWDYWVNVKMHRDYGEVIYVIEKAKPSDLSRGHKKSDIDNVYSFLPWTGANHINITMQIYNKKNDFHNRFEEKVLNHRKKNKNVDQT